MRCAFLATTSPLGPGRIPRVVLEVMAEEMRSQKKARVRDCARRISVRRRQESERKFFRRRSGSPGRRRASTSAWVLVHTGTARASNFLPCGVNSSRRARWSSPSVVILIRLRRRSGFRAAVKVVRSIASNDATTPIAGASGRFKDIISENCPWVRPSGRSALSKCRASARAARCTCRQRQESRTRIVVAYDVTRTLAIDIYDKSFFPPRVDINVFRAGRI